MPTLTTAPPFEPEATPTHAKGRWFYGALIGVWPLAVVATLLAMALGLSAGIALGSALATALAVDFIVVVVTLAVDDGDIQHRSEER
jgi:hypothetical protein